MINPNRYLLIAILTTLVVMIALSVFYYYRAIHDLQSARLQTDLAISKHLPDAIFEQLQTSPADQAQTSPLRHQTRLSQPLEWNTNGLDIIALELLNPQRATLLIIGERPPRIKVANAAEFDQVKQSSSVTQLVSPGWFGAQGSGEDPRHIQISQIAITLPDENRASAVLEVYSDVSDKVKAIYWTLVLMLGLMLISLGSLNLFLYLRLKQDKHNIQRVLEKESKAIRKVDHDALTGLPNRAILNRRLAQAVSHSEKQHHSVVVMFLDLDGFKAVNDSHGHQIGDQVLKIVAQRLNDCVRQEDTIARLGGDEFVVVLPMFDTRYTEQAPEVAQRILESLATPMKLQDKELQLGCSIGVSRYPDDGHTAETLLKCADIAMYQAKEQGRNNVQFFSRKPAGSMSVPTNLKKDLQQALQRREFTLLYQPQLDLKDEVIVGVTACLYWLHPVSGMNLAEKLLPVAKKHSPALVVGHWMLEEACLQRKSWLQQGIASVPLAIYLKANLFDLDALPSTVQQVLESTLLPPQNLELELTGCLLNQDLDVACATLGKLRSLGVRVSVDGTEFSPNDLCQLPLDAIRIGSQSTHRLLHKGAGSIIVRAIIALGRQLAHPVIAEGVDTVEQREYLRAKGCDQVQGTCNTAPLPTQEMLKLLRLRKRLVADRDAEVLVSAS